MTPPARSPVPICPHMGICDYPACCTSNDGRMQGACIDLNGMADGLLLNLPRLRQIDLRNPQPEQIEIADIVNALSKLCRFAGQVPRFYSVAQHSCIVAGGVRNSLKKQALLHDASEAYLNDVTRALKHSPEMAGYRRVEAIMERAIFRRFGLPEEMDPEIKQCDQLVTQVEYNTMMRGEPDCVTLPNGTVLSEINPLTPESAASIFGFLYHTLFVENAFDDEHAS